MKIGKLENRFGPIDEETVMDLEYHKAMHQAEQIERILEGDNKGCEIPHDVYGLSPEEMHILNDYNLLTVTDKGLKSSLTKLTHLH